MADVEISYNGNNIAELSASGEKRIKTGGKYCHDDIDIIYSKTSVPVPSGSVSITENGTYDVTDKAEAVVNVSGGGAVPEGYHMIEFTPASDTFELNLALQGFTYAPAFVQIYADAENYPKPYPLENIRGGVVAATAGMSATSANNLAGRVFDYKANSASTDYWNATFSAAPTSISYTSSHGVFLGGVKYTAILMEGKRIP